MAARNLLLGGNVAAATLAGRPRTLVHYVSENLFLLGALSGARGLPEAPLPAALGQLDGARVPTVLTPASLTWGGAVGSHAVDLVSLSMACAVLRPAVYFEIGTLRGVTALHAALNGGPECRVFTLDLPPEGPEEPALPVTLLDRAHMSTGRTPAPCVFDGTPEADRITRLYGDSATFDFTPYHDGVDCFFIDGAHSYEYVRSDTLNALACCRPGGLVLWHDFGRRGVNGVSRWLRELRALGAPVQAVPGGSLAYLVVPPERDRLLAAARKS